MGHLSYEESKKVVLRGLLILAIVTLLEVFVALIGKGYIINGFHLPIWIMYGAMISMSLYKAYFIVYYFMHMKYEVPGLVKSVLLPTMLLLWAVIAFFTEGRSWHDWRAQKNDRPIASLTGVVNEKESKMETKHGQVEEQKNEQMTKDSTLQTDGNTHDEESKSEETQHH